MKKTILLVLFSLLIPLLAHPGRTDSSGGHYNRKTGGYHYHNPPSQPKQEPKQKEVVKQEEVTPKEKETKNEPISTVRVKRVIDGDTFETADALTVRVIGIDTPETKDPRKPVQYFGEEASAYAKKMLEGRDVRLEYDQQKIDKYGRTLAYVFVLDYQKPGAEIFFNEKIIQDGYAFAYVKYPFRDDYMTRFRNAEREARENNRGLWADTTKIGKAAENDSLIDTLMIPEGYFVGSSKSDKYHQPSCVSAQRINAANLITFKSAEDAVSKGYSPCSKCWPGLKDAVPKEDKGDCNYWLNISSNVRHNSGCRYFKNTKNGRCCGPNEGRACGTCGG